MTAARIITEPLGGSLLSRAIQAGKTPSSWLVAAPSGAGGWRAHAERRRMERDWTSSWRLLTPAISAAGEAAARLNRVIASGGVVVTTGQQPGLFGGPIYTISKAVSAIALADEIRRATGVPAAPIFWAATDDADFAEASSTAVARPGGLDVLRSANAPAAGTPMSLAPIGDLTEQLSRLAAACGSAADSRALAFVRDAYSDPFTTVGGAFVRLMRSFLEPLGMAVLDASHSAVAEASEATLARALASAREVEEVLETRGRELRAAGFDPQVEEMKGLSLVFAREESTKRRLAIGERPSPGARLSPNVLLRPIVEREILPTVAYVAGPGELAYFAQVSAVASALGVGSPISVPRWSCTLIEPHVADLLQRYDATEAELATHGALESRLARASMDDDAKEALSRLRATLASLPEWLRTSAERLDLERAVQGAAGAMQHRVDRLERRLLAGVKRRERKLMTDVATLRAALRPRGERQERVLNPVPLLARQGLTLLDEMAAAARPHAKRLLTGEPG